MFRMMPSLTPSVYEVHDLSSMIGSKAEIITNIVIIVCYFLRYATVQSEIKDRFLLHVYHEGGGNGALPSP